MPLMASRARPKSFHHQSRSAKRVRHGTKGAAQLIGDNEALALARYAAGLSLTIKQLELVIGISRAQLYRLGEDGPPFLQVKRGVKASRRLYFAKDVEPWLRRHTANIQPDRGRNEQERQ